MGKQELEDLKLQLRIESARISNKFAALVGYTEVALEMMKVNVKFLKLVIDKMYMINKDKNKLNNELNKLKDTDITEAFGKMNDYWSFFSYELLATIIESLKNRDSKLKTELDKYVTDFTVYCKRRLCEIPVDAAANEAESHKKVHIKLDDIFDIKAEDVKIVIMKLSAILDTNLCLVGVEKGCVELVCICMNEFSAIFPLRSKQRQKMSELKVLQIYSEMDVYYETEKSINGKKN